jgi:hypothetical protein
MKRRFNSEGIAVRSGMSWLVPATVCGICAMFAMGCAEYQANLPTPPGAPSAAVSFCQSTETGCAPNGSFQVSGTRSLNVVIEWQNLPTGTHSQKVSFVLPSGDEYQAFERSFEVPDGPSGSVTTTQPLQVAGTWIAQRRLSGMWQVNFFLDGTPMGTQAVQLTQEPKF